MRVYYARRLLRVLEGAEDMLYVDGCLGQEVTAEIEAGLKELAEFEIAVQFNEFAATINETIDYASKPIVYMPDEFSFHLDIESLGRLAREILIDMIPDYVATWEPLHVPVSELWVGGKGDSLNKEDRVLLRQAMRMASGRPVRGRTFVLDDASYRSEARRIGTRDGISESGGIAQNGISSGCDYFVTDREEAARTAQEQGVTQIIDTLTLQLMLSDRSLD